ncbi:6-carboxytetrahydropterin synthase [Natronogracilivirgula saccharolytica]|uniref:6-carboxy-5,6,7,8-tetrahydropterin synthase n=1 Tax=Natronogracilivirga saccharolytica TaxID=2812953 RepID=A0A8J7S8H2_9BACT|nr:6-carboxytetrahydropterin synthase [Natronogracilivirga saccharolytica]
MIYVTRKEHFTAAHRLHNPEKSDEWNRETFGPCNHPNWHGHNYVIEVTVAGEPDPDTGYVVDLGKLKHTIHNRVLNKCDHKNLNLDVDFLKGVIPSAENLARCFFFELKEDVNEITYDGQLYAVRLYETERNIAEYREDGTTLT